MKKKEANSMIDILTSLSKQRGFIFQSSEIYGGLASTWDYGPLGIELKRNIKNLWWNSMVTTRDNVVGMDAAILMHPRTWEASGHVENFHDPLIDNKETKKRYRLDHLLEAQQEDLLDELYQKMCSGTPKDQTEKIQMLTSAIYDTKNSGEALTEMKVIDPDSNKPGDWTDPRQFNLMFKTHIGPLEDTGSVAYLRPETAQGIFVNFNNVLTSSRQKLPFGIAQIGKAFRNEITTGNFIFRTREFEQMEMEFFCHPNDTARFLDYWSKERLKWFTSLGINQEKLRLRAHGDDELAHYSSACYDVEYLFDFGWSELEGIADRGTYDLDKHAEFSGKKMTYFDQPNNTHLVPAVVEASAGVDRTVLTVLADAYEEEEIEGEKRSVLHLSPRIAPTTVAVFPLMKKEGMPDIAHRIVDDLHTEFSTFYDEAGSIGRRYRRQDEAGTPFAVTVDHDTLKDQTVTLRDRDTMKQDRVSIDQLHTVIHNSIASME